MCIARFGSATLCAALLAIVLGGVQARLGAQGPAALPDDPIAFLTQVNEQLLLLSNAANRAGWVQNTYITPDTEIMGAQANEALVGAATRFAKHAAKFQSAQVSPAERRQLDLLQDVADDVGTAGSQRSGGADAPGDVDGRRVRARQVLPGWSRR